MDQTAMPSALSSGNDPNLLPQVQRWNWGAFFLSWIWAFAHRLPVWGIIGLVAQFVPLAGWAVAIYLGVKGGELAWRERPFRSLAEFQATERVWAWWGVGVLLFWMVMIGIMVIAILIPVLMRLSAG